MLSSFGSGWAAAETAQKFHSWSLLSKTWWGGWVEGLVSSCRALGERATTFSYNLKPFCSGDREIEQTAHTILFPTTWHWIDLNLQLRICWLNTDHSPMWCWPYFHGGVHNTRASWSKTPTTWGHTPHCKETHGWRWTLRCGCTHDSRASLRFRIGIFTASWCSWTQTGDWQGEKKHRSNVSKMFQTRCDQPRCSYLLVLLVPGWLDTSVKTYCLQPFALSTGNAFSIGTRASFLGAPRSNQTCGFELQLQWCWTRRWRTIRRRTSGTNWHVSARNKRSPTHVWMNSWGKANHKSFRNTSHYQNNHYLRNSA